MKLIRQGGPISRVATVLVAVALTAGLVVGVAAASSAVTPSVSYGFNQPTAIAVNGTNLWIANAAGNSLTETTSAGAFVRTVRAAAYGLHDPVAIISYNADIFVVNKTGSVTEVNASTAALVRVISGPTYHFGTPVAGAQQGGHIWVVDSGVNAVTEFSATTGALIRTLTSAGYGFKTPDAIAVAGANLWVTSKTGGSTTNPNAGAATEFLAGTGGFVRRISTPALGLQQPSGIAFDGIHLWISDAAIDAVTEIGQAGVLVRIVRNESLDNNYGFDAPTVVVASSPYVYVVSPPGSSPMVTQITASTARGNYYECNTNTPDPNFANPTGLVVHGGYIWVVSPADNTLTQLLVTTGNRVNLFT